MIGNPAVVIGSNDFAHRFTVTSIAFVGWVRGDWVATEQVEAILSRIGYRSLLRQSKVSFNRSIRDEPARRLESAKAEVRYSVRR
jgi:hypothetical protein